MKATELKADLLKEMEAEIDGMLTACERSGPLNMTQIEDLVLAARQRLGQKLTERMLALQEQARAGETPVSPTTGRPLHPKGQKKSPSSPASDG